GRESQRLLGALFRDAPVKRHSEVVVVELQAVKLCLALVAEQSAFGSFRQRGEGGGVAVADQIPFSALLEALARELTDRLQHDEARLIEIRHAPQQALVSELIEPAGHIAADLLRGATNRLGLLKARAAPKHREPSQKALLGRVEQLVAPRDRAGARLLATRQVGGSAAE